MRKGILSIIIVLLIFAIPASAQQNGNGIVEILKDLPEEQQKQILSGEVEIKDLPTEVKNEIVKKMIGSGLFDEQIMKGLEGMKKDFNEKEFSRPVKIFFDHEMMNLQIGAENPLRVISFQFQNAKIMNISLEKAERSDVDVVFAEETFVKMITGEPIDILDDYLKDNVRIEAHGFFNKIKYGFIKVAIKIFSKVRNV